MPDAQTDPVLMRRRRIASLVRFGKTGGYGLFLIACIAFAVLIINKPTTFLTTVIVTCLGVGSILLAPAIVFGYGVKAAEREERQAAAAEQRRLSKS